MYSSANSKNIIFLKMQHDRWKRIDLNQVIYIETMRWNTLFFYRNGDTEKCHYSLLKVQSILPAGFERIHRSTIINTAYIEDINTSFTELKLCNNKSFVVGLAYKKNLRKYLFNF